jgi:glycosyltransferase involved in cell wall biosynthesis
MKLCSICVNTYKRPELLGQLLDSLARQVVSDEIAIEIVIVDNDAEASARAVVERAAAGGQPIRYYVEPVQNISLARNKAVGEARGSYIVFIDDDEKACAEWLQSLVDAVEDFEADAAFGRVVPEFDEAAPQWIRSMYVYHTPRKATGGRTRIYGVGNTIVKAEWLRAEEGPFDPRFGRTGGEDGDLFRRLERKGARFVDCYEAVVTEFQPLDRAQPEWLMARAHRTGALYAERAVAGSERQLAAIAYLSLKAAALYAFSSIMRVFVPFSRRLSLHYRIKMSAYSGHIAGVLGKRMIGY